MGEQQQLGVDTTLTKVFVGGLAWETKREALREHFHRFGDILEAVIITDKLSGRSKGYGFVTFKDAEAAKKACEDAAPMIDGRKANCNLASLGARRGVAGKTSPPATPASPSPHPATARPAAPPVPWYFPARTPPPQQTTSAFHNHYPGVVPFYSAAYRYSPSYMAPANVTYNTKPGQFGAGVGASQAYQFSHACQGGMVAPGAFMPMYHPQYQFVYVNPHPRPSQRTADVCTTAAYFPPAPAAVASKLPAVPPAIGGTHARPAIAKAF